MIEQTVSELTAAIKENTAVLREFLAISGSTPKPATKATKARAVVETPAPAEAETTAPAEAETEAPAVTETLAPETEAPAVTEAPAETVTTDTAPWDRAKYLLEITEHVKARLLDLATRDKVKLEYEAIRDQFGVKKAPELKDDQLPGFWEAIQSL